MRKARMHRRQRAGKWRRLVPKGIHRAGFRA